MSHNRCYNNRWNRTNVRMLYRMNVWYRTKCSIIKSNKYSVSNTLFDLIPEQKSNTRTNVRYHTRTNVWYKIRTNIRYRTKCSIEYRTQIEQSNKYSILWPNKLSEQIFIIFKYYNRTIEQSIGILARDNLTFVSWYLHWITWHITW